MKQKLMREFRALGEISKKLIGLTFITAVLGTIVWISCDGLSFVWHTSCLPPFTPPMPIMFFIWLIAYAAFGIMLCLPNVCQCKCADSCVFYALVAYLATLFWCPLVFFTGGFAAILALLLSLFCLFLFFRRAARMSLILMLCLIITAAIELYSLYFTLGFIIIN